MPVISKKLAEELTEKEMRDAYLDEKTRAKVALQIRTLRSERGWPQAELGQRMGKPQSNIARLEDRDIARYTLTTLLEVASAFDCAVVVEFVRYEDFLRRTHDLTPEALSVPSFSAQALQPLCQDTGPLPLVAIGITTANVPLTAPGLFTGLGFSFNVPPIAPSQSQFGALASWLSNALVQSANNDATALRAENMRLRQEAVERDREIEERDRMIRELKVTAFRNPIPDMIPIRRVPFGGVFPETGAQA